MFQNVNYASISLLAEPDLSSEKGLKDGSRLQLSRRVFLKVILGVSGILALLGIVPYGGYLSRPEVKIQKKRIGNLSEIRNNSAQYFLWPTDSPYDVRILIRDEAGKLYAYNAACTHLACRVDYSPESQILTCPCHGSEFDPTTGEVLHGPAGAPLIAIVLEVDSDNEVYALRHASED
jgi:arsenite oxidase small subunit